MFTIKDKYMSEGYSIEELRCKAMKGTVFVIPACRESFLFPLRKGGFRGLSRKILGEPE